MTVGKIIDSGDALQAMVHNKSNLAPAGASQAYRIDPVSGFNWHGEYDIGIDELLDEKKKGEKDNKITQLDLAKSFIIGLLSQGDVLSDEIPQLSEQAGLSWATIRRAKKELGVKSIKISENWYWSGELFQGEQEAQISEVIHMNSLPESADIAV